MFQTYVSWLFSSHLVGWLVHFPFVFAFFHAQTQKHATMPHATSSLTPHLPYSLPTTTSPNMHTHPTHTHKNIHATALPHHPYIHTCLTYTCLSPSETPFLLTLTSYPPHPTDFPGGEGGGREAEHRGKPPHSLLLPPLSLSLCLHHLLYLYLSIYIYSYIIIIIHKIIFLLPGGDGGGDGLAAKATAALWRQGQAGGHDANFLKQPI